MYQGQRVRWVEEDLAEARDAYNAVKLCRRLRINRCRVLSESNELLHIRKTNRNRRVKTICAQDNALMAMQVEVI